VLDDVDNDVAKGGEGTRKDFFVAFAFGLELLELAVKLRPVRQHSLLREAEPLELLLVRLEALLQDPNLVFFDLHLELLLALNFFEFINLSIHVFGRLLAVLHALHLVTVLADHLVLAADLSLGDL